MLQQTNWQLIKEQAPVVQKVDNAIHWINHYPFDIAIGFAITSLIQWIAIYPVDSTIHHLNNWGQASMITRTFKYSQADPVYKFSYLQRMHFNTKQKQKNCSLFILFLFVLHKYEVFKFELFVVLIF